MAKILQELRFKLARIESFTGKAMNEYLLKEFEGNGDKAFIRKLICQLNITIRDMPVIYETEEVSFSLDQKIAHLHYSHPNGGHAFIIERDVWGDGYSKGAEIEEDGDLVRSLSPSEFLPPQRQAWGWCCLDAYTNNGEYGYIDIEDQLLPNGFEIDLEFNPKTMKIALSELKKENLIHSDVYEAWGSF